MCGEGVSTFQSSLHVTHWLLCGRGTGPGGQISLGEIRGFGR